MNNSLVLDRLGSVNRVLSGVFGNTEITPQEIVQAISDVKVRDGLLYAVSDFHYTDENPNLVTELADSSDIAQFMLLRTLLETANASTIDTDQVKVFTFIAGLLLVIGDAKDAHDFAEQAIAIRSLSSDPAMVNDKLGSLADLIMYAFGRGIPEQEVVQMFRHSVTANSLEYCLSDDV